MIKDNNLLREMIEDMAKADNLYQCDEHWKHYLKQLVKEIKKKDLNEFRNWKGGAGTGSIASFGGGKEFYIYEYGWHFHPLDEDF